MKVGLFLDVDKTLTKEFIQHAYARALDCEEEYLEIEGRLQAEAIDSEEFGREIIELFRSKGFTNNRAAAFASEVPLQHWTDDLLHIQGVDVYLVSSGPNYFIEPFAKENGIPDENVCSSQYIFEPGTGLIQDCKAVDHHYKAHFVEQRVRDYDVTVGIGDMERFDGRFMSHCTIQLLVSPSKNNLYIDNLALAVPLIERLAAVNTAKGVEVVATNQGDREARGAETGKAAEPRWTDFTLFQFVRKATMADWVTLVGAVSSAFFAGSFFV